MQASTPPVPNSRAGASAFAKPNYGIDAPPVVWALFLVGIACLVLAWFGTLTIGPVTFLLAPSFWIVGGLFLAEAGLMIVYAKYGKFRHCERMMKLVPWRGDEQVLDVGTGRGLLMIAAARRLSSGKAVGIDIWSAKDLSGNSQQNTLRNAELEGVRDRVEVHTADATKMDFPDASFDVVLSNLCIHNIPSRAGRKRACQEIMRVLKPGGRAVISDYKYTRNYERWFRETGAVCRRSSLDLFTFPPLRIAEAEKH
jgi:arsenite methyltransferase